jgi:hypothetical protein
VPLLVAVDHGFVDVVRVGVVVLGIAAEMAARSSRTCSRCSAISFWSAASTSSLTGP